MSGAADARGEGVQGHGILGALRPKADPGMVERIRQEEARKLELAQQQGQQQQQMSSESDGSGRILPKVSMEPIAPPAEEVAKAGAGMSVQTSDSGAFNPASSGAVPQSSTAMTVQPAAATYGAYNQVPAPPPGAMNNLVPPPPSVTLSTTAQTTVASGPAVDPNNPYGNPYANPYANPYGNPYANPYMNPYGVPYPQQQQAPQSEPAKPRPALFGSGQSVPRNPDAEEESKAAEKAKKFANFVPITPTGMETRSPYKQRDDLRVLWKGAVSSSALGAWAQKDANIAASIAKIDVGLPGESTKGSFSVAQRQVDSVFKPVFVDKRIQAQLKKTQTELVQSYFRYLYSYNRFALSQQTVAARKQEVEVASSHSEQQRAAADLSTAQTEAESTKEDMRSAQLELSAIAGAQSARAIIQKVSGIAPSIESLAQAPATPEPGPDGGKFDMLGSVGSFFGFKKKPEGEAQVEAPKPVKAEGGKGKVKEPKEAKVKDVKVAKAGKEGKVAKEKAPKGKETKAAKPVVAQGDLEPAPAKGEDDSKAETKADSSAPDGISFELKGKNISARKSVLNVAIRNTSGNAFSFSPDDISVQEGTQKLSEAAMRAEFDSTSVQPNQEVKGTITIFGRPWNDRLTISLSDGSRNINMKR